MTRIATCNLRGLRGGEAKLEVEAWMAGNRIGIACVQETRGGEHMQTKTQQLHVVQLWKQTNHRIPRSSNSY